ncbi:hypothetical protein [Nannocystis pusilla]|uniref:hypothetical protein n=1 Tax=Nannocystis pusilla TaxID=889268 RepID=UPI003B7AFE3B
MMLALALGCGKDDGPDDLPDALEGSFHATCNWDGACDPDIRYFRFEGEDYDLRLAFASDILVDADLASLRQHLQLGEAEFADGVIPESTDAVVCGQEVPSAHLEDFSDGRLRGSIEERAPLPRGGGRHPRRHGRRAVPVRDPLRPRLRPRRGAAEAVTRRAARLARAPRRRRGNTGGSDDDRAGALHHLRVVRGAGSSLHKA